MAGQDHKREAPFGDERDGEPSKRQKPMMSFSAEPRTSTIITITEDSDDDSNFHDEIDPTPISNSTAEPQSQSQASAGERLPIFPMQLDIPVAGEDKIANPTKKYSFRSTTISASRDFSLTQRVMQLETFAGSVRSLLGLSLHEPKTSHTRRHLDNLVALERQTNTLETQTHNAIIEVRNLKTKVDGMLEFYRDTAVANGKSTESKVVSAVQSVIPTMPGHHSGGGDDDDKHDDDDDVMFLEAKIADKSILDTRDASNGNKEQKPQPKTVNRSNFVAYLKSLDFRNLQGVKTLTDTPVVLKEYTLCTLGDGTTYFLRLGTESSCSSDMEYEEDEHAPIVLPRHRRGHHDFDENMSATSPLNCYRDFIFEIEYHDPPNGLFWLGGTPRYAFPLGEIYVRTSGAQGVAPRVFSTNYFLFMDVVNPQKSLWIMYGYEYCAIEPGVTFGAATSGRLGINDDHPRVLRTYDLKRDAAFCPGFGIFDMACIAKGLDSFKKSGDVSLPQLDPSDVNRNLRSTARIGHPVFTQPNLAELAAAIGQGWDRP